MGLVEKIALNLIYCIVYTTTRLSRFLFRVGHGVGVSVWNRPGLSRLGVDSNFAKSSQLEFLAEFTT